MLPSNEVPIGPGGERLPDLSDRQEVILALIVREYIRTAQPVGSKSLVEEFNLGVSSATVRNDMVMLEQYRLIYAPHTSAGRVPAKQGCRYFVQRLLTEDEWLAVSAARVQR